MEDQKKNMLVRIYLMYGFILVIAILIIVQVIRIQFVEADNLVVSGNDSANVRYKTIPANRGSIYSSDGKLMATSVPVFDIYMDVGNPTIEQAEFLEKLDSLALGLHLLFKDRSQDEYYNFLRKARNEKNRYLLIKRKVSYEELTVIRKLPILRKGKFKGGLITEPRDVRAMPYVQLAYRTIGWDKKGRNLDVGLEGAYSKELSGKDGIQLVKRLPNGIWKPVTTEYLLEPQHGMDVHTTIDMYIQDIAESALMQQLQRSGAHHGCVIVMEVGTGFVKAIANLQRNPGDSTYTERYNHAIGESYEPGSTFKLASVMAALEDGYLDLDDTIDIGNGEYSYSGYRMVDASKTEHGKITVRRAFEVSSNVGISKAIVRAYSKRPEKFSARLNKMGVAQFMNLDLPGEGKGFVKSPDHRHWSRISLPWMAIGYEVRVTPLQLLTFYNAVANKGRMMKPQFVSHISNTGVIVKSFNPEVLHDKIASEETIRQVHEMMVRVVDHGTATNIRSNLYKIAGKTGTARIASGTEGYGIPEYVGSFAGFFPADNPKYSCIVMISKPVGPFYGGTIAAPVFKTIADRIYAGYLDLPHEASFAFREFSFPSAGTGLKSEKQRVLAYFGINLADSSKGNWVRTSTSVESILLQDLPMNPGIMPDLRGITAKDAVYLLEKQGVFVVISGKGKVSAQSPEAGSAIKPKTSCNLILD